MEWSIIALIIIKLLKYWVWSRAKEAREQQRKERRYAQWREEDKVR